MGSTSFEKEYAIRRLKELKLKNKGKRNWSLGDCLLKNKFEQILNK